MLFSFAHLAVISAPPRAHPVTRVTILNPSASPAQFTVADFNRMGDQSGFRYRLPQLDRAVRGDPDHLCIAEGRVEKCAIRPGLTLVLSDVRVHQHLSLIHI